MPSQTPPPTSEYVRPLERANLLPASSQRGSVYARLREELRDSVLSGGKPGDRVPSERQLALKFGVSPITISRALQELQNEGAIERIVGKGTFIRRADGARETLTQSPQVAQGTSQGGNGVASWMPQGKVGRSSAGIEKVESNTYILANLGQEKPIESREYWGRRITSSAERALQRANGQTRIGNCRVISPTEIEAALEADINSIIFIGDNAGGTPEEEAWVSSLIRVKCGPRKVPVVQILFGSNNPLPFDAVRFNGAWGAHLAAMHLMELGHKRIAFLSPGPQFHWAQERALAFQRALASAGITDAPIIYPDAADVARVAESAGDDAWSSDMWEQIGHSTARDFLTRDGFTAVLAANDHMAAGFMEAARLASREIPRDFSVVGFDDWHSSSTLGLTTLHVPVEEMGEAAAALLLQHLSEPFEAGHKQIVLNPVLVVRSSTRVLAPNA